PERAVALELGSGADERAGAQAQRWWGNGRGRGGTGGDQDLWQGPGARTGQIEPGVVDGDPDHAREGVGAGGTAGEFADPRDVQFGTEQGAAVPCEPVHVQAQATDSKICDQHGREVSVTVQGKAREFSRADGASVQFHRTS